MTQPTKTATRKPAKPVARKPKVAPYVPYGDWAAFDKRREDTLRRMKR